MCTKRTNPYSYLYSTPYTLNPEEIIVTTLVTLPNNYNQKLYPPYGREEIVSNTPIISSLVLINLNIRDIVTSLPITIDANKSLLRGTQVIKESIISIPPTLDPSKCKLQFTQFVYESICSLPPTIVSDSRSSLRGSVKVYENIMSTPPTLDPFKCKLQFTQFIYESICNLSPTLVASGCLFVHPYVFNDTIASLPVIIQSGELT